MSIVPIHSYSGARAMIELHETHMHAFLVTWRRAKAAGLKMPVTGDPTYESLAHLLHHVLRCSRHYIIWMCDELGLPDPAIDEGPDVDQVEAQMDTFNEHIVERWRTPLRDVPAKRFSEVYSSAWGVDYCIDGMLEHAVMHPIRHTYQLSQLMRAGA